MALKETEEAMEIWHRAQPEDKEYGQTFYAELLAENQEIARAEELVETVRKDILEGGQKWQEFLCWVALASIERVKGDKETALGFLEKAAEQVDYPPYFYARFDLATAYLETDRLADAVAEFDKLLSKYHRVKATFPIRAVKAHYLLGLAYEKSGWNDKAIEQYGEFLETWKDADPGISEIEDARQRLVRLTSGA